jgi:hypothetical protein
MQLGILLTQNAPLTFDELLAKVVDDVFKSIFTERVAFSLWIYLETMASIERLDVARKPEAFLSMGGEVAAGYIWRAAPRKGM